MINERRQKGIQNYLKNLNLDTEKDYSLWEATKKFKRIIAQMPPLMRENKWTHSEKKNAELFVENLRFFSNRMTSN